LPNVGPYIYDVSISGFTRSSIYIHDISSLRVNVTCSQCGDTCSVIPVLQETAYELLFYIIAGLMPTSTMKLHTSVDVEWDDRVGIFNIRLWRCNILVPHCLYLNVLCDFSPWRLAVEEFITIGHDICSQLNIQWPCYCILSFYYFMFPILLWLFSFASSRFPPFHYYPFPLPPSFLIFFTLISRLPSHSSSPLYSIPLTPHMFPPLFTAQASLTQCASALSLGLITRSVHPS